ncbi:MAG TPA: BON domain-containing protein [Bacteriovoracaceae bacterium]|nr:BON domain-containing protein [Bacteriovoracaceae bacterium]
MDKQGRDDGRFKPSSFGKTGRLPVDAYEDERGMKHWSEGPKVYQRSDVSIKEEVCEQLTHSDYIDASELEVSVIDGIVTLEGFVNTRSAKWLAEDLIEDLPGVVDIQNHIKLSGTDNLTKGLY